LNTSQELSYALNPPYKYKIPCIISYLSFSLKYSSSKSHKFTAYHINKSRETLPAVIVMQEAIHTASPGEEITLVTDGNLAYPTGIYFINQNYEPNLTHKKVVGL